MSADNTFLKKCNRVFETVFFINLSTMPKKIYIFPQCCNPLNIANHKSACKDMRKVTSEFREKFPGIPEGAKICGACRKKTSKSCDKEPSSSSENDYFEIVPEVFVIIFWIISL